MCAKNIAEGSFFREAAFLAEQRRRYQEKKLQAIQLTRMLTDPTYRDLALSHVIPLRRTLTYLMAVQRAKLRRF